MFVKIVKSMFYKAKEEGKDPLKSLMIYHNTPLTSSLQSLMQIRTARSNLPMSNAARKQFSLDSELLRNKQKNKHLPLHDLHLGKDVMFQDATSKQWFPATITRLCSHQEVTRLLQGKVSPIGRHKHTWSHTCNKARRLKIKILYPNLVICGNLNLIARSLLQLTIKYNLILGQNGTLSPQLNLFIMDYVNIVIITWI